MYERGTDKSRSSIIRPFPWGRVDGLFLVVEGSPMLFTTSFFKEEDKEWNVNMDSTQGY